MKSSGLKILLIFSLFVCSATIATIALAQKFPPMEGGKPGMAGSPVRMSGLQGLNPFLRLNLSQDQQKNLLDILEKYQDIRMAYMDAMMAIDQEIADVMEVDDLDEENARAVFRKQAAVQEEMMILEIKMNNEIKAVLSSEQLELLKRPGRPFPPQGE